MSYALPIMHRLAVKKILKEIRQRLPVSISEDDNLRKLSEDAEPGNPVAVVPMMLDHAFNPLWNGGDVHIRTGATATLADLSTDLDFVAKPGPAESADPMDMYPPGSYVVLPDRLNHWRYEIELVARRHPGYCFPFYPFDPRRPIEPGKSVTSHIEKAIFDHGFVGIKLYTRMGWRLAGNCELTGENSAGQELDRRVREVLLWAASNSVPVLNHCSPGGWPVTSYIAFPKGFSMLHEAELKLLEIERQIEPVFDAHASLAMRVLAEHCLSRGEAITLAIVQSRLAGNRVKNIMPPSRHLHPRQSQMSTLNWNRWTNQSLIYAKTFAEALQRYVRLTVAPDPAAIPPGVKFCFAHCGSDAALIANGKLMDRELREHMLLEEAELKFAQTKKQSLPDPCFDAMLRYARLFDLFSSDPQQTREGWLSLNSMVEALRSPTNYVDISYFSGLAKAPLRVSVFTKAFKELSRAGLQGQVLFGTDWPMTLMDGLSVNEIWTTVRTAAQQVTEWPSCWEDITRKNPLTYLGLQCGSPAVERQRRFHGKNWESTWMAANGW